MVDKHNKMEDRKKTSPMIGKKKELRQLSKKWEKEPFNL